MATLAQIRAAHVLGIGLVPGLAKLDKEVMRTHDLEFSGRPSLPGRFTVSEGSGERDVGTLSIGSITSPTRNDTI
uniref:Uncharacterized protein n=1 Tax=Salix viminalis TaxID=40686 RepID=A0A6N2KPG0_SALVM